jgi:hypothetical protein
MENTMPREINIDAIEKAVSERSNRLKGGKPTEVDYNRFELANLEGLIGPAKIPAGVTVINCVRCHTEHYMRDEDGVILSPISATPTTICTAVNPACKHPLTVGELQEEIVITSPISVTPSTVADLSFNPYTFRAPFRQLTASEIELGQLRAEAAQNLGLRYVWELDVPSC